MAAVMFASRRHLATLLCTAIAACSGTSEERPADETLADGAVQSDSGTEDTRHEGAPTADVDHDAKDSTSVDTPDAGQDGDASSDAEAPVLPCGDVPAQGVCETAHRLVRCASSPDGASSRLETIE